MAEPKTAKKQRRKKKREVEPCSRGIAPDAIGSGTRPRSVTRLAETIEVDGNPLRCN